MTNKQTGDDGEQIAAAYLRKNGYEILATNWRSGHKEIDLVAQHGEHVVFVEVKTRFNSDYGFPEEAVTSAKRRMIAQAADEWIFKNKFSGEIRFDIIAILKNSRQMEITHFTDAFAP